MITMVIDHIGIVFFADDQRFRVIGRLAFPLYTYALVLGYGRTRHLGRYFLRLAVIAVISQLPYVWALGDSWGAGVYQLNVVGTLLVCLAVLYGLDRLPLFVGIPLAAAAGLLLELLQFDYGYYALALTLLYRYVRGLPVILAHLALNTAMVFLKGWLVQMASLFSTLLIVYGSELLIGADRARVPRWLWRSFYPLHLLLIAAAARYLPV